MGLLVTFRLREDKPRLYRSLEIERALLDSFWCYTEKIPPVSSKTGTFSSRFDTNFDPEYEIDHSIVVMVIVGAELSFNSSYNMILIYIYIYI